MPLRMFALLMRGIERRQRQTLADLATAVRLAQAPNFDRVLAHLRRGD